MTSLYILPADGAPSQVAQTLEYPTIRLDVWSGNHGARRLYERFGFRLVGQSRGGVRPPFEYLATRC